MLDQSQFNRTLAELNDNAVARSRSLIVNIERIQGLLTPRGRTLGLENYDVRAISFRNIVRTSPTRDDSSGIIYRVYVSAATQSGRINYSLLDRRNEELFVTRDDYAPYMSAIYSIDNVLTYPIIYI